MESHSQSLRRQLDESERTNRRLEKKLREQKMRGYHKRSVYQQVVRPEYMTWEKAAEQGLCNFFDYADYGWNEAGLNEFSEPLIWISILGKADIDDLSLIGLYHAVRYMFIQQMLEPSETLEFSLADLGKFSKWKSGLSAKLKALDDAGLIEYRPAKGGRRVSEIRLVSAFAEQIAEDDDTPR